MEHNIEAILQRGIEFHKNNQFLEAESCYKQVLGIDPNNADAIHLLGLLADATGDKDLAVDLIKNAIAIDPTSPVFYGNLANILKFKNEFDLAIACYLEAIKLNPAYAEACFNLANLYRDLNRLEDAIPYYRLSIELEPDFAIAHINIAEVLHKLGQPAEAISCYRKHLELKPGDIYGKSRLADALFEHGVELEGQSLKGQAIACFEEAASIYPSHIASRNKLNLLRQDAIDDLEEDPLDEDTNGKRIVVVLGMHRSGTSSITRALEVMGVSLGDKLIPPMQDNEKGFWEDAELLSLNDSMLSAIGSAWHHFAPVTRHDVEKLRKEGYFLRAVKLLRQKVRHTPIFGFKDPRLAKLYPFWKEVLAHCKYQVSHVLVIRNPLSVADSLVKRNNFPAEKCYLMWLEHVVVSWIETSGNTRTLVDFDRLIESPERELIRMAKSFGLGINSDELEKYRGEFLDENMRHAVYSPDDLLLDEACPPLVRRMYAALLEVASDRIPIDDEALNQQSIEWLNEFSLMRPSLILSNEALLQVDKLNQTIAAQDQTIAAQNQTIAAQNQTIAEQDQTIAAQDQTIAAQDQTIAAQDQTIAAQNQTIAELKLDKIEKKNEIIWMNEKKGVGEAQISALTATMAHGNFEAGVQTAKTLLQQGRLKEALGIAELLLTILKDYQVVLQLMIDIGVAFHNRRDLNMATLAYRKVLEKEPKHAVGMHLLGLVLSQQDRCDQAMELIEKSISLCQNIPLHFLKNAGLIAERLSNPILAESYYKKAIAAEKAYPDAYLCLNALLQSQGRIPEAEKCLVEGLEHIPNNVEIGAQLQHLYYKSKSLPHPNS